MKEVKKSGRKEQRGQPLISIRLSPQQRKIARQVAIKNGRPDTVAAGIHILLAQAASQLANT